MSRRKRTAIPYTPGRPAPTPEDVVRRLHSLFPEDMALLAQAEREEKQGEEPSGT